MSRRLAWCVVVVGLVLAAAMPAMAQGAAAPVKAGGVTPVLFEVRLNDGSVLYGTVESETPDRIVFKTIAGVVVDLARTQIAALAAARGEVVDGVFRPADPNATRLLFSPTARSLRKGQGYVGVYEFVLPFVQYGVTDRFTIGAGTPLVFVGDESGRIVWLTPKYQFYKAGKTTAAVGVMHFVGLGEEARVGLAYAVATTGTDDNAWTLGAGLAYARYEEDTYPAGCYSGPMACVATRTTESRGSPVVMIGGERRISRRAKLITENYGFKNGGIVSVGVRFLGERLSADLGIFSPLSTEGFFAAPVVNVVWLFGK